MGTVLVVDDEARNRSLVRAVLEPSCTVVEAGSAAEAYALLAQNDIDLVLLDVMMPHESGVEAARRIKADTAARGFLPVIMLTALSEQTDRNAALQAGADDFITKPFDKRELQLRVDAFLRLRAQDVVIRRQRDELQKVIDLKDDLFSLLVHDLRNPLTSVIAMLALLRDEAPPELRADAGMGLVAAKRVSGVLDDILQLIALEAGQMPILRDPLSLHRVATDAQRSLDGAAKDRDVSLTLRGDAQVLGDGALLRRAVENLLANAVRYAPRGSSVDVEVDDRDGAAVLAVSDKGPGVPDDKKGALFVKFGGVADEARQARRSYGFGLYLVDLVARAHFGSARVYDREGGGARFELTLPRSPLA